MKTDHHAVQKLLRITILFGLVMSLLSFPKASLAALGITAVTPNTAPNNLDTLLTVTGTDFANGAIVSLQGGPALATTFVNATTLTALLPAGTAPGVYSLVVTNPDASQAVLPNSLTVFAPSPPTATATATATSAPPTASFERPLVVIQSYRTSPDAASPGGNIDLYIVFQNSGQRSARNILLSFTPGSLLPLVTGGIIAIGELAPGDKNEIRQPFSATWDIWGLPFTAIDLTASYQDAAGESYVEKFSLTIPVVQPKIVPKTATPTATATPTSTPPPLLRPQIVISQYATNVKPLQPGFQFELEMQIQNVGNDLAKNVTMIIGGGSAGTTGGTVEPGGVSGSAGEFTNFAPLGSSNIQALGDLPSGTTKTVRQSLIVNVTTNPGAYPMRISFTYLNARGASLTDEQVITLLVYSLPNVDVNFYRDPGMLFAGQPNMLPLQIVNLGRKSAVLGNMRLTVPEGEVLNNTILIGPLEPGGYYTLDATWTPLQPGPAELTVTIDYTDDFNQPQQVIRTIPVVVQEAMIPEEPIPGGEGFIPSEQMPETFWQKLWRLFLGLIGLDSARPSVDTSGNSPITPEESAPIEAPLKGP